MRIHLVEHEQLVFGSIVDDTVGENSFCVRRACDGGIGFLIYKKPYLNRPRLAERKQTEVNRMMMTTSGDTAGIDYIYAHVSNILIVLLNLIMGR